MARTMNNHVFKGHKTLLGSKYVTYRELELPTRYEIFPKSYAGFDWGNNGNSSIQLAYSILYQLSSPELAEENAVEFTQDVISKLNSRDWILKATDVLKWIDKNCEFEKEEENLKSDKKNAQNLQSKRKRKSRKNSSNVVKTVCKELEITQKQLAEILEVPEGTVSSWAVKDEIPRLGKKAIEFYILNMKNQKIVDSYKVFQELLANS
jgi:DNA-binding transcriptional regulator YiaG